MEPTGNHATRLLHALYFHAVLPRDVPSKETGNLYAVESELTDRLLDAVKILRSYVPSVHQQRVDALRLALSTSKCINVGGKIDKTILVKELSQLDGFQTLFLFATEQNCALYVYRDSK